MDTVSNVNLDGMVHNAVVKAIVIDLFVTKMVCVHLVKVGGMGAIV